MSDRFAMCCSGPVHSAATSGVGLLAADISHRVHIYDWLFGHGGAAADAVISNQLQRFTAVPTGTQVTPIALDLAAGTAAQNATQSSTGGTYSGCLITIPTNQRASHRWVAAPDGELVIPATASNGIAYTAMEASLSTNMHATFHFMG